MYKDIKMASNGWILTDPNTGEQEKMTVDGIFPINKKFQEKRQPIKPETDYTPRLIMRNGEDVVVADEYVNDKYLYKK